MMRMKPRKHASQRAEPAESSNPLCNWSYVTACLLANKYVVYICKTHVAIRFTQQIGNVKHVLGKEQQ